MTEKIKIGMIGLGGIASRAHMPVLASRPDVILQAGAEIDEYQANRIQKRFGLPHVYREYEEMLEQEALDAVYVCLPNRLHFEAAGAALRHRAHVYCEKPVGLCAQEADSLAQQAEQAGLAIFPGYHLRFQKNYLRAKKLLEERRLGKILQVQASAVYSGPYRGWDPKGDWYFDPKNGGPLYDWGSHLVDLLFYITKIEIECVAAWAQHTLPGVAVLDNIAAAFQGRGGVVGTLNLAWGTRGNLLMLQIHGSAGSLLVSDDYFEHRAPTGGGLNKLGMLLSNAQDILNQKTGSFLRREANDNLYSHTAASFLAATRAPGLGHAAMRDAVRVHRVLEGVRDSIEQERAVQIVSSPTVDVTGRA